MKKGSSFFPFLFAFILANAIVSLLELIAPFHFIISYLWIAIYTIILYTKFKNLFNEIKEDKNENINIMLKNE
jgi:hypothetical protein